MSAPTCSWYEEDDDGSAASDLCGKPATHYSCVLPGSGGSTMNACETHKCRCGSTSPTPEKKG